MPGFPLVQIAGLAMLCAIMVTMALDKATWRISWIVGVPWILFLSVAYFMVQRRREPSRDVDVGVSAAAPSGHKVDVG
jgi:L-asparagine transporter-like permease